MDIFDGLRARRQRSGSPVGRLVDEAFDLVTLMCMSIFIGYGIQPNNCVLELLFFGANIVAYSMEMRFTMFHSLVLSIGEFGPIENELILGAVLGSIGYLTPEFMQTTAIESLGATWGQVVGALFLPTLTLFSLENVGPCMARDWFQTMYYYVPILFCIGGYLVLSFVPSYETQRVSLIILVNMVIADISLNLMMHNMTGRRFSPLQPALLLLLIPIVLILGLGLNGAAEDLLIKGVALSAFLSFYVRMSIICRQYVDFANRTFFFRQMNYVDKSC